MLNRRQPWTTIVVLCSLIVFTGSAVPTAAQAQQGTVSGTVLDPLGARVPNAAVTLGGDGGQANQGTTNEQGEFTFSVAPGRYQVTATAESFSPATSAPVYVGAGASVTLDLTLQVGPLQAVVVTVSAAPLPQSQTGAPVTVLDESVLERLEKPALAEALRLVPGSQIEQTGGRGGTTSMFIRGGASTFAKVLIDGIPANDIGGGFDFSQLQATGVGRIEVLRQTNSVMYGSDALTGVIDISTRRGRSRTPELTYSLDGGRFSTFNNALSIGGVSGRLDYFSEYAYYTTDNSVPNNDYRNHTWASRVGVALGRATDVSGTLRILDTYYGSPNAFSLYGIADDSTQDGRQIYAGVSAQSQWSDRWQSVVRFGSVDQTQNYLNPAPTGLAFDPFGFGANYLGNTVTIRGANGYSATGRAILDFGGVYPSPFDTRTTRHALSGNVTYTVAPGVSVSGGARFDREAGFSDPEGAPDITRKNGGVFAEVQAAVGSRTHVGAGIGYEHNAVFKSATTPRLSVATYLRPPASGPVGDTKLTLNVGKGIKAPSVFQEQSSLFTLLQGTPSAGLAEPVGPERSRMIDVGLEQGLADGQVRVRVSYFHNRFEDLLEFVSKNVLPQLGVPANVAQATPFGAYLNSSSTVSKGVETSLEALLMTRLRLMASYTYTDAEVIDSFGSSALAPAINPSIPGIPIGAFAPLVGGRPFRLPTNAGNLLVSYADGPAQVTLAAYFSGKRDGSTFLSDEFFGNSLLLPNKDLEPAYQKVDLSGAYRVHPRLRLYVSIENLFDKDYESSFGFPSLPRTARAGLTVSLGGDEMTRTP